MPPEQTPSSAARSVPADPLRRRPARRARPARRCPGPSRRAGRPGCARRCTNTCWPCRTRYSTRLRPGRQVQGVVLVDRRRHDQQRDLPDLLGLRPVLDQLEHLGAQHHGARGGRDVRRPTSNAGAVDHLRHPRRAGQVAQRRLRAAADQAQPAGVDRRLRRRGLTSGTLLGASASTRFSTRKPHPLGVAPVQVGVGDQLPRRSARRPGRPARAGAAAGSPSRPGRRTAGPAWTGRSLEVPAPIRPSSPARPATRRPVAARVPRPARRRTSRSTRPGTNRRDGPSAALRPAASPAERRRRAAG